MILIALMWTLIPPSPDHFKSVNKYQNFQTPFYNSIESVANIVYSFQTNSGWKSVQKYQTVAIIKDN